MTVVIGNCPNCAQLGSVTRLPLKRAYIRVDLADGDRRWNPIGWYCRNCRQLWPESQAEVLRYEQAYSSSDPGESRA